MILHLRFSSQGFQILIINLCEKFLRFLPVILQAATWEDSLFLNLTFQ